MTKPSNIESIEQTTKKSWKDWLLFFEDINAKDLSHKEIADKVHAELEGKVDSAGWWSQGVTVAYEQHIGRRAPGQRNDGTFEFSNTRVLDGTKEKAFEIICDALKDVKELNGHAVENVRTSVIPVRSYWRCDIGETRVNIAVGQRSDGKAMVSATHAKLMSQDEADVWRAFWKQWLSAIEV